MDALRCVGPSGPEVKVTVTGDPSVVGAQAQVGLELIDIDMPIMERMVPMLRQAGIPVVYDEPVTAAFQMMSDKDQVFFMDRLYKQGGDK